MQTRTVGVPPPRPPWYSPNRPPHGLLPAAPIPRPGPPLFPLTVLHLDNIASGHPVGGDKDIVGALDTDEVLHGGRRPGTAGSMERGTVELPGLTGETAQPSKDPRDADRATVPANGALDDVQLSREFGKWAWRLVCENLSSLFGPVQVSGNPGSTDHLTYVMPSFFIYN